MISIMDSSEKVERIAGTVHLRRRKPYFMSNLIAQLFRDPYLSRYQCSLGCVAEMESAEQVKPSCWLVHACRVSRHLRSRSQTSLGAEVNPSMSYYRVVYHQIMTLWRVLAKLTCTKWLLG